MASSSARAPSMSPKPLSTMFAPWRARALARPKPMPLVEPVTRAVLPCSMGFPPNELRCNYDAINDAPAAHYSSASALLPDATPMIEPRLHRVLCPGPASPATPATSGTDAPAPAGMHRKAYGEWRGGGARNDTGHPAPSPGGGWGVVGGGGGVGGVEGRGGGGPFPGGGVRAWPGAPGAGFRQPGPRPQPACARDLPRRGRARPKRLAGRPDGLPDPAVRQRHAGPAGATAAKRPDQHAGLGGHQHGGADRPGHRRPAGAAVAGAGAPTGAQRCRPGDSVAGIAAHCTVPGPVGAV